jgi:hypothetical protein
MTGYLGRLARENEAATATLDGAEIVLYRGAPTLKVDGVIININTADRDTLMTIKGIGPARADTIIASRNFLSRGAERRGFTTLAEADKVLGRPILAGQPMVSVTDCMVASDDIAAAWRLRLDNLKKAEVTRQAIYVQLARTRHQGVSAPTIPADVCTILRLPMGCARGRWGSSGRGDTTGRR